MVLVVVAAGLKLPPTQMESSFLATNSKKRCLMKARSRAPNAYETLFRAL
jgi:hypothetical protein